MEESEKQQEVILTENCIRKVITRKGVQNYDQRKSGKLNRDGRRQCGYTDQESSTA